MTTHNKQKTHNIPKTNISTTIHHKSWQVHYKFHDTFFFLWNPEPRENPPPQDSNLDWKKFTGINSSGLKVNVWLPITKPKSWKTGRPSTESTGFTGKWAAGFFLYQTLVSQTQNWKTKNKGGSMQNQIRCKLVYNNCILSNWRFQAIPNKQSWKPPPPPIVCLHIQWMYCVLFANSLVWGTVPCMLIPE